MVAVMAVLSIGAPLFAQHDPLKNNLLNRSQPPSLQNWFGTDRTGRDVFARTIYGGRISLMVGLVAVSLSVTIGTVMGLISGFYGGIIDNIIMRLTDVIMSFPPIVIIMASIPITAYLISSDNSIFPIMAVIGLLTWPQLARLIRGQTLTLRQTDYVTAAQGLGASQARQMFVHILPQCLAPLMVFATFGIANAILLEAGLSFLGQGVQPPTPSWGNMIESARSLDILENLPWSWLSPGLFTVITVVSINFIGDALRDAVDPKSK
jgi:peptide/nickel transport system permease protein